MSDAIVGFVEKVGAGTWPEWVAAVGTTVALLIAALTYASDAHARRQSQARLVYTKIARLEPFPEGHTFEALGQATSGHGDVSMSTDSDRYGNLVLKAVAPFVLIVVEVHNGSQELIGPTTLRARNTSSGELWDFQAPVGFVEPGAVKVAELYCTNPHSPNMPSMGVDVRFRDASGRWWKRVGHNPIEQIHNDPENDGPSPADRAHTRLVAENLGIPPTPEPRPSLRVRAHRLGRRIRGKTPIP